MFELNSKMNDERIDEIGENHIATSAQNPLRADAFDISDEEKINRIQKNVKEILHTLLSCKFTSLHRINIYIL